MKRIFSLIPVKARMLYFWHTAKDALLFSSPFFQRILLSIVFLVLGFCIWNSSIWHFLRSAAPHERVASQTVWGAAYAIVGLLQVWSLLDPTPHPKTGLLVNGAGFFLLATSTVLLAQAHSPYIALTAYAAINAMWITLRTGATALDQARS